MSIWTNAAWSGTPSQTEWISIPFSRWVALVLIFEVSSSVDESRSRNVLDGSKPPSKLPISALWVGDDGWLCMVNVGCWIRELFYLTVGIYIPFKYQWSGGKVSQRRGSSEPNKTDLASDFSRRSVRESFETYGQRGSGRYFIDMS